MQIMSDIAADDGAMELYRELCRAVINFLVNRLSVLGDENDDFPN